MDARARLVASSAPRVAGVRAVPLLRSRPPAQATVSCLAVDRLVDWRLCVHVRCVLHGMFPPDSPPPPHGSRSLCTVISELMGLVYDTALAIKERIYGNRIVLFAPLYLVWGGLGGVGGRHGGAHMRLRACVCVRAHTGLRACEASLHEARARL
jgi:hypothetical protein